MALKTITLKLDEETVKILDDLAKQKGTTRSDIIRRAIELYLTLERKKWVPKPRIVRLKS